jgi:hypothetical protein
MKPRKIYCCGGAEEPKEGDGDAAATVAHAVKGGDGEDKEDVDAAAALPHAVAPVGAPSVYCCGGERSVYCFGGAEGFKGSDGEEEKNGDALLRCHARWRGFTASGEIIVNRAASSSTGTVKIK